MKKTLKAIALIFVVAAVVFEAGCAQKAATGQVVTGNDSGKTINLKNGENFTLILRENPSTGYLWELNLSKGLSILSNNYTQDPTPPGVVMVGVPGNHIWLIQAIAPGSQQINGICEGRRGDNPDTEEHFTLSVEVI